MKYASILLLIIAMLLASAISVSAFKIYGFVSEFGGKGEALGKLSGKIRIAFDKSGNIYVLDTDNLRVQKLDPDGRPLMEIVSDAEFAFANPMDIAVDGDLNIYVMDWRPFQIVNTHSPKIFNYGPCIYKFSKDGKYAAIYTIDDLTQKALNREKATPAIDMDGNFALMIFSGKMDRNLYISVNSRGDIYVLDQDMIYRLDSSGKLIDRFAEPNAIYGQLSGATGMAIDIKDNLYIADTGNNRILKFGSDGKFISSFGKKGDGNGYFTGDLYVRAASDGTILVSDSAKYEKILKTSIKSRKLIDSSILVTGQDDPIIPGIREFETIMRHVQRFDEDGNFVEKILYTIDKSDPELNDIEFKAMDADGNLYLLDKDRIAMRKYSIGKPAQWSDMAKTFTFRFQHNEEQVQLDNFYDINNYYDFDEHQEYTMMSAIFRLNYDMTETFNISFASSLMQLNGTTRDKYPGEYADPYGYIQNDETIDKYTTARMRIDFRIILDHDPFKYRVGDLFLYLGGGKYKYSVDATDINNERRLNENLWWAVWAAGMSYDLGDSMRISLIAAQHRPMGYMNYDYVYWDESGMLYSTGLGEGTATEVFISINGAF